MGSFFWMDALFSILFFLVFGLVLAMFLVTAVRGIGQWRKNNASPVLTVDATVVAKREHVSHHRHNNDQMMDSTSTSYHVTFEVESGDRIELNVPGSEYGLLAEGDRGRLTFQGTRYKGFARVR